MDIESTLLTRTLEENIRDLHDLKPGMPHTLLLINYNSLMEDFYKGSITAEVFEIRKRQLWESLFFFVKKLKEPEKSKLVKTEQAMAAGLIDGKKSILYISASPVDIDNLQVDFEFNRIKAALEAGAEREKYDLLLPLMSVTLAEFLKAKHQFKPTIIHFSGHGQDEGLMFSNSKNEFQVIPTKLIEEVFSGVNVYTELVVLNACYASAQAKIISATGVYVLGMNAPVTDDAALFLSENFYRFISNGQNVEEAYNNVKIMLELSFPEEVKTLEIWKNGKLLKKA